MAQDVLFRSCSWTSALREILGSSALRRGRSLSSALVTEEPSCFPGPALPRVALPWPLGLACCWGAGGLGPARGAAALPGPRPFAGCWGGCGARRGVSAQRRSHS